MIDSKEESWAWLTAWISEFPDDVQWTAWKSFLLPLLTACVDAGLDRHFRAGQSMHDIIVSTAEEHGLEKYDPPPPRITLRFNHENQQWSIAWSYGNLLFSKPDRYDPITAANAFAVLKSYLADLWRETRPSEALPAPLATGSQLA